MADHPDHTGAGGQGNVSGLNASAYIDINIDFKHLTRQLSQPSNNNNARSRKGPRDTPPHHRLRRLPQL